MKKIIIMMIALVMMAGCSHREKEESTIMITRDKNLYALYNQDGDQLTEYLYKTYEEIQGVGYLVTDTKDRKGLISFDGEELIVPGTYETLQSIDQMFYATKKVEKKKDEEETKDKKDDKDKKEETKKEDPFIKENLYVLDASGQVLYKADKDTGIHKTGLPIILKDKKYIVLYGSGKELYTGSDKVEYAYQKDGQCYIIGFETSELFYATSIEKEVEDFEITISQKGHYKILLQNDEGAVLSDSQLKSMIYIDFVNNTYYQNELEVLDAYFDESNNIILKTKDKNYAYDIGKSPILLTSYYMNASTYVSRSTDVYGPHQLYKNGIISGEMKNCQLYPEMKLVTSEIFPVFTRNKGYEFYNFNNYKVIDKVYLEAEAFTEDQRAIVKESEEGYILIDDKGNKLTNNAYYRMKYIGSSYYAVYNENGMYGIINRDGKEIFEIGYTTLPDKAIVNYQDETYMILGKNGRTYVYDVRDDMNVILSVESDIVFDEKGYFIADNQYFNIDGEVIE